jgi:hypothetical protein
MGVYSVYGVPIMFKTREKGTKDQHQTRARGNSGVSIHQLLLACKI